MKKLLAVLFVISALALQAQKLSFTPFIGIKAEIGTGEGAQNEDYAYFKSLPKSEWTKQPKSFS